MRARRLKRVAFTILAWMLAGALIAIYDHLAYLMFEASLPAYALSTALLTNVFGAAVGGGLAVTISVFYLKPRSRARSFPAAVALQTAVYAGLILLNTTALTFLFQAHELQRPLLSPEVRTASVAFLTGAGPLKFALVWVLIGGVTSVVHEVSDYFGPEQFRSYLLGRYHRPRIEGRTFMFLDLRSSTTIAERLGHVRYFELLQDLFADVAEPLVDAGAQVYQYVGDEVVMTWEGDAAFRDDACVGCYFAIADRIRDRAGHYLGRYGVTPSFRAGLHTGPVTTGEVGRLRKEIVHSGDVLNAAARIQGKAKELDAELLVSGDVVERLSRSRWEVERLGAMELRGRSQTMELWRVSRHAEPDAPASRRDRDGRESGE